MTVFWIVLAAAAAAGLFFYLRRLVRMGRYGMKGPFRFLGVRRLKEMPGNAPRYRFTVLRPMERSPLAGKSLCVLGSSVAFGAASLECAVGEYLAARFGCTLIKEAVSGTTLVDTGPDSYVSRMKSGLDPLAHFDLFLCQLSTNDATQGKPLGEIAPTASLDDFDVSTVTGALEYIICYAKENWQCPVAFFTGSRYDSPAYAAMVERLFQLQKKWDILILDLWHDDDFNAIPDDLRDLYMADPIHPTKAGYRDWWGPEQERQLLAYLSSRR